MCSRDLHAFLEQDTLRFLDRLETGRMVMPGERDAEHVQVGSLHLYRLNQGAATRLLD